MAKPTTFTSSLNRAVSAVTATFHGKLSSSTTSAILLVWMLMLNDYAPVQLPWLRPAIQVGAVVIVLTQFFSALPLLSAAVIAGNTFLFRDKIDHSILSDLIPVFLWLQYRYKDAWFLFFLVGFYFATSGFSKLYGGWLSLETKAVYSYVVTFEGLGRTGQWTQKALNYFPGWLWEVLDYATVALELVWLIVAVRPRMALVMIPASVLFHIGTFALLGISFQRMYLVYALMLCITHRFNT